MKYTWLLLSDLNGIMRGKLMPKSDRMYTSFSGVFVNDALDTPIPDLNKAEDIVNVIAIPDPSSSRDSPWNDEDNYLICDAFTAMDQPSKVCPRTLLKNILEEFAKLGMSVTTGIELEWTLFDKATNGAAGTLDGITGNQVTYAMIPLHHPKIQKYTTDILTACQSMDIELDAFHAESGKSMFEVALAAADPLRMADNVQLFKLVAKREAIANNMEATFMAKPYHDAPGCGEHIHISLKTDDGRLAKDILLGSFLAGVMEGMRDYACLLLPASNSYKRITGNFWTSSWVTYGIDDRSNAIRIVNMNGPDARIEIRIGGGDMNPYLGLFAVLSSGLRGIKERLEMKYEPGKPIAALPASLDDATRLFMSEDSLARKIFGDAFVNHYGGTRKFESQQEAHRSLNWERHVF